MTMSRTARPGILKDAMNLLIKMLFLWCVFLYDAQGIKSAVKTLDELSSHFEADDLERWR